jgi:hypothetical protein
MRLGHYGSENRYVWLDAIRRSVLVKDDCKPLRLPSSEQKAKQEPQRSSHLIIITFDQNLNT